MKMADVMKADEPEPEKGEGFSVLRKQFLEGSPAEAESAWKGLCAMGMSDTDEEDEVSSPNLKAMAGESGEY
jgi:hypothetical protein